MIRPNRGMLLATVSTVAILMAWGPPAQAADVFAPVEAAVEAGRIGAGPEVWVAVEGRYNIFTNSSIFGEYSPPYAPSVNGDPKHGWSAGLELGARPAGSQFDFVGRLLYGKAKGDGSADAYYGYPDYFSGESDISVEEQHIVADFEVGRHLGVGLLGGDTRVHAGLRFIHFDAEANGSTYTGYGPGGYADFNARQKITAIGPRIGIDQTIPLAGNFRVDLGAAGAVLFGHRERDKFTAGYYSGYFADFFSASESVTVWNAEASAGLTYLFGHASATIGYRVDAFWGLYDPFDDSPGDRITHGPFAKLKINFGGGGP